MFILQIWHRSGSDDTQLFRFVRELKRVPSSWGCNIQNEKKEKRKERAKRKTRTKTLRSDVRVNFA